MNREKVKVSRPLRIEFPGAVYHVTARGNRREAIFVDDVDRTRLLEVLAHGLERFDAQAFAYCLLDNHYHFVLRTRQANLSRLMRHVNGVYTQDFNRRHAKVGHLFQGRFKSVLVDRDAYLAEVCRYVELNPVRSGMVEEVGDWVWSSYRVHVGLAPSPAWLDTAELHGYLLGHEATIADHTRTAAVQYAALVAAGRGVDLWSMALRQQIYLGDEGFVSRMQALNGPLGSSRAEIPRLQVSSLSARLDRLLAAGVPRDEAAHRANVEGGMTMTAIARELGLSVSRVSRMIAAGERATPATRAPSREVNERNSQLHQEMRGWSAARNAP